MVSTTQKQQLLIMDDDEGIRDMLQKALSIFGYKVCLSSHGAEAIDHYLSAKEAGRPFDALILDLFINNGIGGIETISRLRNIDPDIKALVSSGNTDHPAILNHKNFGFKAALPKPYSLNELETAVRKLIYDN